jgi:hypothetical protein
MYEQTVAMCWLFGGTNKLQTRLGARVFDASLMLDLIPIANGPETRPTVPNDCRLVVVAERVPGPSQPDFGCKSQLTKSLEAKDSIKLLGRGDQKAVKLEGSL